MQSPDLSAVVAFYYKQAFAKEAEVSALNTLAVALQNEARALRKLAQDTEAQFPDSKPVKIENGPMLTNMPEITFEELQKELAKKAGRVKHVAARLKAPEDLIRDLIRAPNSNFRIAARGWIVPKMIPPHIQEAA